MPNSDAAEAAQWTPRSQWGRGCWQIVGQEVRQAGSADQKRAGAFLAEAQREIGSSYEATVWRKREDGTRKAYTGALCKFLRYNRINGFMAPREALKGRMLQLARDGQYESPFKAAVRPTIGGKNGHHTSNRGTSGLNVR